MPAIQTTRLSAREEAFAVAFASGMSGADASRAAGYSGTSKVAPSVDANKRLKKAKIANRVRELQAENARAARISVASLTTELLQTAERARAEEQYSAAVSAYTLIARLHGLITDRHRIELDMVSKPLSVPTAALGTEMSYEDWQARWSQPSSDTSLNGHSAPPADRQDA